MKLTAYDKEGRRVWTLTRPEDLLLRAETFNLPEWWSWDRPGTTMRIVAEFDDGSWTDYTKECN